MTDIELKRAYVYAISVDSIVRYIGKGTGDRLKVHRIVAQELLTAREKGERPRAFRFYYHLAKAIKAGQNIEESILFGSSLSDAEAYEIEIREIAARRDTVWNQAAGGNAPPSRKGKVCGPLSTKHRAKISIANLGKATSPEARAKMRTARLGKVLSPETRAKISASSKGRVHGPHSAEARAKISAALMGRVCGPRSAEHLTKLIAANLGKHSGPRGPRSAEYCANISAARIKYWAKRREQVK